MKTIFITAMIIMLLAVIVSSADLLSSNLNGLSIVGNPLLQSENVLPD
ncbi:hypothetical protein HYT58_02895 [Candidatus Woesearchaeota archaeon]|nr:hypothetical protein [Candidatus Woesearchaeota archaeon]